MGFGCGAVDLVSQDQIGEDGAILEAKGAATFLGFLQDIGTDDIGGHQIRRKLNARELQLQGRGQGADEQGFAEARDAFKEGMAAGQHADEDIA